MALLYIYFITNIKYHANESARKLRWESLLYTSIKHNNLIQKEVNKNKQIQLLVSPSAGDLYSDIFLDDGDKQTEVKTSCLVNGREEIDEIN